MQDLDELEDRLSKSQWLGGAKPTQEDAQVAASIDHNVDCRKYPFTYAWISIAGKL